MMLLSPDGTIEDEIECPGCLDGAWTISSVEGPAVVATERGCCYHVDARARYLRKHAKPGVIVWVSLSILNRAGVTFW